jgi:hypothetical protein
MKEAQRHRIACQHPMGSGIIERQKRLRAITIDDLANATVNRVECLIPGDPLELTGPFCADTLQWMAQAVRAVDELRI